VTLLASGADVPVAALALAGSITDGEIATRCLHGLGTIDLVDAVESVRQP